MWRLCAGCVQELSLVGIQPKQYQQLEMSIRLDPAIFCNVKRLWLKSNSQLKIHIPAAVHPASLEIYADVLDLSFEDVTTSCANLTDVNLFFFATTDPSYVQLLRESLTKKGGYARLVTREYEFALVTSMPPSLHKDNHEIKENMKYLEAKLPSCRCTMCWACMGR